MRLSKELTFFLLFFGAGWLGRGVRGSGWLDPSLLNNADDKMCQYQ